MTARRTLVKVCGLTHRDDAAHAAACGADWLGFVIAAGGPREIEPERMAEILDSIPGAVGVAVVANARPDEALALATRAGAARLQLHRTSARDWPDDFPVPCAFVAGVDHDGQLHGELAPEPHLIQLDTADPMRMGGTGRAFAWDRARALVGSRPFVLAGGLDDTNVAEAIATAAPMGVDASSRLEREPGRKDPDKVRRFVAAVRRTDESDFR